jgi:hypothetical protein
MAILPGFLVAAMIGGEARKINRTRATKKRRLMHRRAGDVTIGIEAFDREYETLAAKLYVLHLPNQLFDLRAGGLGLEPGQPRLL